LYPVLPRYPNDSARSANVNTEFLIGSDVIVKFENDSSIIFVGNDFHICFLKKLSKMDFD